MIVLVLSPLAAYASALPSVENASSSLTKSLTLQAGNVTVHGVRLNVTQRARLIGRLRSNRIIRFNVVLNYDSSADAYVQSIYDPASSNYHQFLTPESFADTFGPTPSEYQNLVNWLQNNGVNVTLTAPDRLVVEASAPARTLERAFNITFSTYQYGNQTFYANDVDPQVPRLIGGSIRGFVGFHNLTFVTPDAVTYNPAQIRTAYDSTYLLPPNIGYTGSGRTIDILDAYNYPNLVTDLNAFDSAFSLPAPALAVVSIGSPSTCPTPPSGQGSWCLETALDTQWGHAMAPGATLHIILVTDNTDNSLLSGINYVVNTDLTTGGIFSNSWGEAEMCTQFLVTFQCNPSFVNNVHPLLLQAASQGITTFFATGDNGAYVQGCSSLGCSPTLTVEYPASDPYVTAVGGTSLNSITGPSETAWSSSGGGISALYPEPSYQSTYFTLSGRGVPDVSMDADPNTGVYVYCNQGTSGCNSGSGAYTVGGTSLATPLWAGSVALIEQAVGANLGYLNPLIYQIYGTSEYSADFHDVTSGNNGYYSAGTGWDAVTGLGTPDLFKMAQYRGMTKISVSPNPVTQTQTLFYSGSGFTPNTQVQVVIWNDGTGYIVGTPTSSNSGTVSGSFFVGGNIIPGTRRLTLTDSSTGYVATTSVQVIELTLTATQSTTTTTTAITSTLTSATSTSGTTTTTTTTSTSTTVSGYSCVVSTTTTSVSVIQQITTTTTSATSTSTTTTSTTGTLATTTFFTSTSTLTVLTVTTTSACTLSLTSTSTTSTTSTTYPPRTVMFHTTPTTFVGTATPGSISACSGSFTDGQSSLCGPTFSATANLPSPSTGWQFDHWAWSGGVTCTTIGNTASCSSSLSGGSLTAVYAAEVSFQTNPSSSALISWGSCDAPSEGDGQSIFSTSYGSVTACYVPSGYTLSSWSCSGGLVCSGSNDPTLVTFNGPGTITLNLKTGSLANPVSTSLTASAFPASPVQGTSFTVSGTLTANGGGLGGEQIALVFGWNLNTVTVTTQTDGSYTYTATAPTSAGSYDVQAFFLGDYGTGTQYLPSTATATISVS